MIYIKTGNILGFQFAPAPFHPSEVSCLYEIAGGRGA